MTRVILLSLLLLVCTGGALWLGALFLLPPKVTLASPTRGAAVEAVYATGTVEPSVEVPIAPRVAARIAALPFDEGAQVHRGDVLVQLEDTEYLANLAELQASYDLAVKNFERNTKLHEAHSVSDDALDQALAARDSAKAKLDKAKAQNGYMALIAPADGLLIRRDGEIGEYVPVGQPIFYLSCCAPLRISVEVDEEDIPRVVIGQKVLIQNDAFQGQVFEGKVSAITPRGDSTARSYRVRVAFNDDHHPMMIGMTAETNIILREAAQAILLPRAALGAHNKLQILEKGHVKIIAPKLGSIGAEKIEVIEGLSEQAQVLSPYMPDVPDGSDVRIDDSGMWSWLP